MLHCLRRSMGPNGNQESAQSFGFIFNTYFLGKTERAVFLQVTYKEEGMGFLNMNRVP